MKKLQQAIPLILLSALGIMLILKLSTLLSRQFDPDEMSYLHWAYLLSQGKLPYQDFFFYITPFYPGFLRPLFLLPYAPATALFGRLLMFGVYLLTLRVFFSLAKLFTKNLHTALLAVLVFTAFPMTFDKTIEIRPDMVMVLFFLIGVLLLIKNGSRVQYFLSGFFLSVSFLTMYKIIFAVPSILLLLLQGKKTSLKTILVWGICGALVPVFIFFLYLTKTNLISQGIQAMIHDSAIVNIGNSSFPLWMTLSPWPLIYVQKEGISFPWILNSFLWLFMIPGIYGIYKHYRAAGLFLGILLISAIGFLFLFPKPYVQYFIIPSMIAAIGTAWLVTAVFKKHETVIVSVLSLLLLLSFSVQTLDRQIPLGSNQEQLDVLQSVLSVIKPDEPVYDMVGSYVFRPDGYYICCHPYIQFAHLLKRPLPTLTESLISSKTKFLVMDQKGYVFWIAKPEDLAFMTTHYLPSAYKKIYTLGSQFQCNQGSCIQLNVHGQPISEEKITTIDVVIEEQYKIRVQPSNKQITINAGSYINDQIAVFAPGVYRFSAPPAVTSFSIQLDR